MYEAYWKLKEKPFENTPDPRFMYYSKKHEEALTKLLYGVKEGKGAVLLTGEYGSGKTILSRIVIGELIKNKIYELALITHPQLTPLQFIQEIAYQLKNEYVKGTKLQLLHEIQDIIYRNFNQGKKTVIMIDEAQIINSKANFEELRLLLNFQLNDKFLITLVLIGQPELAKKVSAIPQLRQRLGIRHHLTRLDANETKEYVLRRLFVAGRTDDVFEPETFDTIYKYSRGIPREINNICDMALFAGLNRGIISISREFLEKISSELNSAGNFNYAQNV